MFGRQKIGDKKMNQCQVLRALLKSERPLIMPDAYDALSARLIQNVRFKAVQCSGYSMALSVGCKTEDDLSFDRNLQITQDIIRSVSIPVMADGEDGFGPPEEVVATVKAFVNIGVSGINLEDQNLRTNGPKSVIDTGIMVEKIVAPVRLPRNVTYQTSSSTAELMHWP
jgi:2-methylisocitrate lyase-like PEP mutase family enzyme